MSRKDRVKTGVTSVDNPQIVLDELEELMPGETATINGRTYMFIKEDEEKDNN